MKGGATMGEEREHNKIDRQPPYRYRLISTGHSSTRYGSCEICGEHCAEVYHQVEERQYKPGRFTRYQCSDLWGHKECLESSRR